MKHRIITRMDALQQARRLARRFGGYSSDYYYKLLYKYNLWN